eukprot:CAMPEP_0201519450 /NCGR_PEP_ID=MMETSP0161_2-20130828/9995_1 /ASSEMBLY_ACC=CAM_ASM_000251 /TAXON_ID=180227 /ORGANISM="Neoparamoeba aestuarina, Strain SoJaBio B1-5/56/2" /LENGTH=153 /DNA_ID=CAMNT_0047917477 /DNA_START=179 /DNA_END=637 /DNA_ORIENTATION=+
MASSIPAPADLFQQNPIRFIEDLATSDQTAAYGNTPRPSSAETYFISAMSQLHSKNYPVALDKLTKAVEIAEQEEKQRKNLQAKEALAVIQLECGFVHWLMKQYDQAVVLYTRAVETFGGLHGKDSPKMEGLFRDYAQLLDAAGKKDEALEVW